MADARVDEALQRIFSGERLDRRERKVAYNGAESIPIREEVLARYGEEVITRNAYGAHCLNSPYALFADIDFSPEREPKLALLAFVLLALASAVAGMALQSWWMTFGFLFLSMVTAGPLANQSARLAEVARGGAEHLARKRLVRFLSVNPSWNVRLYRTPAGYRVLATHQPFEANTDVVRDFFAAVSADPVYVRMCMNQNCFRARLTAKPWRIGLSAHMRPRPGVWPVRPELVPLRNEWIANYETRAAAFSACRYIESMGSGVVHESLKLVVDLHDRESRAQVSGARLA